MYLNHKEITFPIANSQSQSFEYAVRREDALHHFRL